MQSLAARLQYVEIAAVDSVSRRSDKTLLQACGCLCGKKLCVLKIYVVIEMPLQRAAVPFTELSVSGCRFKTACETSSSPDGRLGTGDPVHTHEYSITLFH